MLDILIYCTQPLPPLYLNGEKRNGKVCIKCKLEKIPTEPIYDKMYEYKFVDINVLDKSISLKTLKTYKKFGTLRNGYITIDNVTYYLITCASYEVKDLLKTNVLVRKKLM